MTTRKAVLTLLGIALTWLTAGSALAQATFNVTYGFDLAGTTTGTTDPTPPPTAPDVTFSSFTAVGYTPSNPNATNRFSWTSNPGGGLNANDDFSQFTGSLNMAVYFEVTLTPLAAIELEVDSIAFSMRRSGTGVRSYAVRSSIDSYAANLPAIINNGNANLGVGPGDELRWLFDATSNSADQDGSQVNPGASHAALTTPVTFRFYGWNAEAGTGTFSIDNVVIAGKTRNVPEPATGSLLALGLAAAGFWRRAAKP